MKKLLSLILLPFAFLTACSPMFSSDLREVVRALGEDKASVCARASGGAGALTIAPGALAPGAGYGALVICRSNQPGSVIKVDGDTITIMHGVAEGGGILMMPKEDPPPDPKPSGWNIWNNSKLETRNPKFPVLFRSANG